MRPVALLVALCFTPVADACFLKCFRKAGRDGPPYVVLRTATIVSINGELPNTNPEVPAGVAGIPVVVQTNFFPSGLTPHHLLDPSGTGGGTTPQPLRDEEIRPLDILDPDGNTIRVWHFTYTHLPRLRDSTQYELQISVGTALTDPPSHMHTP